MRTYYQRLGEELALRPLIERFYHLMDEQKEFFGIRQLHSRQLDCSRARRFRFLCGLARRTDPLRLSPGGGPGIGSCAPGFPLAIARSERDQWMAWMRQNREEVGLERPLPRQVAA